jgi:hypothetical protein
MNLATAVALATSAALVAAATAATTTDLRHRGRRRGGDNATVIRDVTTEVGDNRILSIELRV